MAGKKQQPPADPQKFPRKSVFVRQGNTERETAQNMAEVLTSPELAAYRVINGAEQKSGLAEQIDVPAVMAHLRQQAAAVNGGDMATAEAMLMNQATALQSLFARLAERGMGCNDAAPFECNMRMALRAQAQCRATLETLAAIKNPPVVFARQANIAHGPQQKATMRVTSPNFPGLKGLGAAFEMLEEWYAMKNFAKDLHVILVQETKGMKGDCYQRPPFPSTWARMHGKGRVFFTSLAHREDVWEGETLRQITLGGLAWTLRDIDADITPNIDQVTPQASVLKV